MNGFSVTRGSNIFSMRSNNDAQITTFCQQQLENYFER